MTTGELHPPPADAPSGRPDGIDPDTHVPDRVREVVLTGFGGPEVLVLKESPTPPLAAEEVLIAMEAAGVAFNDITTRRGLNPGRPPRVLGFDVVGRVLARGSSVTEVELGQRVGAVIGTGGYASHVLADQRSVVPMPVDLDAAEADALLLNYAVAYQMLHDVARVQRGQRLLVHGAAGGVGSALVQLARLEGAEVVDLASAARRAAVEEAGAVWAADVEHAEGAFDAVFDSVGGPSLRASRAKTRRTGVVVAFGSSFLVGAGYSRAGGLLRAASALLRTRLTPGPRVSLFLIETAMRKRPQRLGEVVAILAPLVRERQVVPVVTRVPLARAAEAHALLENRQVHGKLVLVPGQDIR